MGEVPELESEIVLAVYDSSTGELAHTESIGILAGAPPAELGWWKSESLKLAKSNGATGSLAVLEVPKSFNFEVGATYRVDLETQRLVKESAQPPKAQWRPSFWMILALALLAGALGGLVVVAAMG